MTTPIYGSSSNSAGSGKSFELRFTSYTFIFGCKLQVIDYCISIKLIFICKLQLVTDFTSYELLSNYEFGVTVYCVSYCLLLFINFYKTYKLYLKSCL